MIAKLITTIEPAAQHVLVPLRLTAHHECNTMVELQMLQTNTYPIHARRVDLGVRYSGRIIDGECYAQPHDYR